MSHKRGTYSRLLVATAAITLLVGLASEVQASFWAFSTQVTSNYRAIGPPGSIVSFAPNTSTSAAQLNTGVSRSGTYDALQSFQGLPGTAPPENFFGPKGMVDAPYARGDALVTSPAAPPPNNQPFSTNNVAESFLTTIGNASASGSWSVTSPITITTPSPFSMTFDYTNQLRVFSSGLLPALVQADFGYTFTMRDAAGNVVFSTSPTPLNQATSLVMAGSISQMVTTPTSFTITTPFALAAGTYTGTFAGTENVFINVVPEPSSLALLGVGLCCACRRSGRQRKSQ